MAASWASTVTARSTSLPRSRPNLRGVCLEQGQQGEETGQGADDRDPQLAAGHHRRRAIARHEHGEHGPALRP